MNFEATKTDKNVANTEVRELSRYVLSTSQLGWINCDRFYRDNDPKINFVVNPGVSEQLDVKLVFHSIRAVMSGRTRGDHYVFPERPYWS